MSFSAIIPVDQLAAANEALELQGFGPDNFSVPLVPTSAPGDPPTHVGLNSGAAATAFRAAVEAIPDVSIRVAPVGTVEFDEHAASLGLTREPTQEPTA